MTSPRRQALLLAAFTVGYNLLEGAVALFAARAASSAALFAFGLDSFVESLSGSIIVWRFWKRGPDPSGEESQATDRKATRLVGYTFFLLGAYVTYDAGKAILQREPPDPSTIGLILAIASLVVMPVLYHLKRRLGESIGSDALVADSKETLACVLLSAALLVGLGLNHFWQLWWADPAAALAIAFLIFREGYETVKDSGESS